MKSKDDKSKRRALKLNSSSRAYGTFKGSGSYAEISCIAQKENEPKAVSRDSTVLYTVGSKTVAMFGRFGLAAM